MATFGTEESDLCREVRSFVIWHPIAKYWLSLSADTLWTYQSNISQYLVISQPSVSQQVSQYLGR